jgi:hypothetical protein
MQIFRINLSIRGGEDSGGGVGNKTGPNVGGEQDRKNEHKLKGSEDTGENDGGPGNGAGNAGNAGNAGGLGGGESGGMEGSHVTGGFEGDGPPKAKS